MNYHPTGKGIFCISVDVELLWGRHDRDWKTFVPIIAQSRSIIQELLDLFGRFNIPATWAIVGHLFLKSCQTTKSIKHPEIIRPNYKWHQKDWFDSDPASTLGNDPGWYGRDIIQLIKKYPRQEIACHSFSHIIFGDPGCSKEAAESDIRTCMALAKKEGIKHTSFIFPRNNIGHLSVLKKYGFTAYRGSEPPKLVQLLSLLLPLSPPVFDPIDHHGIWEIPPSMYFVSARGVRRWIPDWLIVKKVKIGIDRAVAEGKIFHLWLHPEDLVDEKHQRIQALENIISYAILIQKRKGISILPMKRIINDI